LQVESLRGEQLVGPVIDRHPSGKECSLSSSDNSKFEPLPTLSSEGQAPTPVGAPDPFLLQNLPQRTAPPVEDPVWNFWDVVLIALLTIVAMVVLQLSVTVAALRFAYPHTSWQDVVQKPIVLLISQLLIYIVVAAFMIFLVEGKYHVPFWKSIHWEWPRSGWKLLALGAALLFALDVLQNFLPLPKDTPFEHLFERPRDAYLLSIIAVSIGPLMEELFFRGFLYPVLARRMGVIWGILLTALPFGIIHLPQYGYAWGVALVIVLVGVACGVVRAVTKSVGASFLVHVGYNGMQMLIAVIATRGFTHMPKGLVF
jgi:membrane protease YdiL (CAAX protease family)